MDTPETTSTDEMNETFDPFPVPQTIPSGWDLTSIIPDLEPAPVESKDFDTAD